MKKPVSPYSFLVTDSVLSESEVELAHRTARRRKTHIEEILSEEFQVRNREIGSALAKYFDVPYEPFRSNRKRPSELLKTWNRRDADSTNWLPIESSQGGLTVVLCTDPENIKSSRVVEKYLPNHGIEYRVTTQKEFNQTVDQFFGGHNLTTNDQNERQLDGFLTGTLRTALDQGATDVHFESFPLSQSATLLFRIDGSLARVSDYALTEHVRVITQVKVLIGVDPASKQKPMSKIVTGTVVGIRCDDEFRLTLIPLSNGSEDLVIHIVPRGAPPPFRKLGLWADTAENLVRIPFGTILFAGGAGSGKATTAISFLGTQLEVGAKVWCLDSPAGPILEMLPLQVRTVKCSSEEELWDASEVVALADPDVLYLGMLDSEIKVRVAEKFANEGFLVIANVHAESSAYAILSYLEYGKGIAPWRLLNSLVAILSQRLVRRLCLNCKQSVSLDLWDVAERLRTNWRLDAARPNSVGTELAIKLYQNATQTKYVEAQTAFLAASLQLDSEEFRDIQENVLAKKDVTLMAPQGCEQCGGSGYRGRVGVHEYVKVSDILRHTLSESASHLTIRQALETGNYERFLVDAIRKTLLGVVSLDQLGEVMRKL